MMLKELYLHLNNRNNKVNLIKFISDYVIDNLIFERNGVWEYKDKIRTTIVPDCGDDCLSVTGFVYRIEMNGKLYNIPESEVVVLQSRDIINKDYTKSQWNKDKSKDALVEDGNYVKANMETFGMEKPVKDIQDQSDYDGRWKEIKRKMDQYLASQDTRG